MATKATRSSELSYHVRGTSVRTTRTGRILAGVGKAEAMDFMGIERKDTAAPPACRLLEEGQLPKRLSNAAKPRNVNTSLTRANSAFITSTATSIVTNRFSIEATRQGSVHAGAAACDGWAPGGRGRLPLRSL